MVLVKSIRLSEIHSLLVGPRSPLLLIHGSLPIGILIILVPDEEKNRLQRDLISILSQDCLPHLLHIVKRTLSRNVIDQHTCRAVRVIQLGGND